MKKQNKQSVANSFKLYRLFIPIIIGFGIVAYLFYIEFSKPDFDKDIFSKINFTFTSILFLFLALLMMLIRDIGYVVRLKILSDGQLTWKKSINIIFLWEFASAVSPSAIGGTSVAVFFINSEGVKFGKATAMVMATSFLDELFFAISFPLLFLIVGYSDLFALEEFGFGNSILSSHRLFLFVIIGFSIKLFFVVLIGYGLFKNPYLIKWLLIKLFSFWFLKKWKTKVENIGEDLITASKELKNKPFSFWFKAWLASFFSWTARYWVANFLIVAFTLKSLGIYEHFIIFSRQLVMWIMMLVSPTPGASGMSEFVFPQYLGEFIEPISFAIILAFIWRIVSYYPYLFIGIIIFPRWLQKKIRKN